MNEPRILKGGISVDDRGAVSFVNEFNFAGVKRFYMVDNHRQGFVRAWHAHKREAKYALVVQGTALVAAVAIDDWAHPSRTAKVHRFILSDRSPSILYIPEGHANGFMSLTADTKILFFSTASLEESQGDDIRYDARYWDPWSVEER